MTNRTATLGAYAYPYNPIDMFDCKEISEEHGNEKELLNRLQTIANTYTKLGYVVQTLKIERNRIQETHTILVKDVFVKKLNKKMKKLFVSVWVNL